MCLVSTKKDLKLLFRAVEECYKIYHIFYGSVKYIKG